MSPSSPPPQQPQLSEPAGGPGPGNATTPLQTLRKGRNRYIAPVAAICMAGLLYIYARTSIQTAKLSAQRTREADGGQINWRNESLRRHGVIEKVEETRMGEVLLGGARADKEEKERQREKIGQVTGSGRR